MITASHTDGRVARNSGFVLHARTGTRPSDRYVVGFAIANGGGGARHPGRQSTAVTHA